MSVTDDPLAFFEEANDASRHKLAILSKYLKPLAYKIGSRWPQLWIVDGFAGAGEYQPDDDGVAQPGSPRIAAVWAKELERTRGRQVLRCINVESHPRVYEKLRANLAPWKELVDFRVGEFAIHLDGILETIGTAPAFFFLDPFGGASAASAMQTGSLCATPTAGELATRSCSPPTAPTAST